MRKFVKNLEHLLALGGTKKDVALLCISGAALVLSLTGLSPLPFDPAWIAIVLCGLPILLEAFIGLVTSFDIKADVLVSLALIASVCIGEDFAAGEVAFIMQLGALLEDLRPPASSTTARKARCPWSGCGLATCCASCPARPFRWTALFSAARPRSTRR